MKLDDHSIALTASEAAAKLSAEEMTTEERRKASSDMSAKIKELQKEHREAETQLKNEHIGAVRSLVNEKEMLCRGMEVLQESIKSAEGVLKEAKEKSAKKEIQLVEKVEAMRRENILNIEEEQRRGDRSLSEAAERASCVEAEIKAAFREECLKYESQIEVSRSAFEALDIRWRKRESRPEDVRRIHLLEIDCAEKEEIVVKTREEMVYFKRELLNREENFNQKFGRSPVVGVMQVLRPKDSGLGGLSTMDAGSKPPKPSTSVGGFGGVRSSKPTYSVSNGGNNTGMEMSMGSSGLGSGSAPGSVSSSLSNTEVSLKAMGRRSFS